ncbi:MAG: hypothetical protein PHI11_04980 [Gallionella sp.]|nr:hypothetical protein [Gallionella sp.]
MSARILFVGGMLMAVSTPLFAAGSHCSTTEETVFSCHLGRKVVSVCASKALDAQSGYLQYRFGALGKSELMFPKTDVAPKTVVQARTLMFAGGGGAYLRFNRGVISYVVYTAIGKGWGTKDGVAVERKGKTIAHFDCKDVPVSEMGEAFFTRAGLPEDAQEFELP